VGRITNVNNASPTRAVVNFAAQDRPSPATCLLASRLPAPWRAERFRAALSCATPMGVAKGERPARGCLRRDRCHGSGQGRADVTTLQLRPGLDHERAAGRDVQQRQFDER
jgi:hypothetical protein